MPTIDQDTFRFMADLQKNNRRDWFHDNRKRYEDHVREPMKALAASLSGPVSLVLPEFYGKPHLSRINNDLRFSRKRPPYKEHVWISFADRGKSALADIFTAIGEHGWASGCGIGASSREPLDTWRSNLLNYRARWRQYAKAIGLRTDVQVYADNLYKKPLYPDVPEDLLDLVQAKGVWIVETPKLKFTRSPEEDFFDGICRMLPVFLFMTLSPVDLQQRLDELGDTIPAPNDRIAKLWAALQE